MNVIQGLHGAVALVLLCSLLFAEEAGVPLPAPGELILVSAGLLIAAGGLNPWLFAPLAALSAEAGALAGYSWARLVGAHGLRALADRLGQGERMDRVSVRLRAASPLQIALSRLIPGVRVYTSLVAGAAGVSRWRFLAGITPTVVIWVVVFTALGALVGVPAERYLTELERLAVQGVLLVVIGVGGYLAARRVPIGHRGAFVWVPSGVRVLVALAIDLGVIASIVTGVLAILNTPMLAVLRGLIGSADLIAGWADTVIVIAVIAIGYLVAARRGAGATVGEALLGTTYLRHRRGRPLLRRAAPRGALAPAPRGDGMVAASRVIGLLASPQRLRVLQVALDGEQTAEELAGRLDMPVIEVAYQLGELRRGGYVMCRPDPEGTDLYCVTSPALGEALAQLLGHAAETRTPQMEPADRAV
jgi:membrane protein DedA with SNARE-associated domain/DNA-binding transcriptional ArsR family regulator